MVRGKPREDRKYESIAFSMKDTPVLVVTSIVEGGNSLPVSSYSLPESIFGDRLAGTERECHDGSIDLGECLDGI
jgi:hypothetical protein